jgi:phytoene dehydrogenase-like protein
MIFITYPFLNGGIIDISQIITRSALRTSLCCTSAKGIYICSSSSPPGCGVHGMHRYYAVRQLLNHIFIFIITL